MQVLCVLVGLLILFILSNAKYELFPKGCRYRYKHYNQKVNAVERPNLLNQIFKSDDRNKIWVGDITYIPTKKGTLYLSVFIDIYSRKVVGWSMDKRMKDTHVIDVFMQAHEKEHPQNGLIVHTHIRVPSLQGDDFKHC